MPARSAKARVMATTLVPVSMMKVPLLPLTSTEARMTWSGLRGNASLPEA